MSDVLLLKEQSEDGQWRTVLMHALLPAASRRASPSKRSRCTASKLRLQRPRTSEGRSPAVAVAEREAVGLWTAVRGAPLRCQSTAARLRGVLLGHPLPHDADEASTPCSARHRRVRAASLHILTRHRSIHAALFVTRRDGDQAAERDERNSNV